MEAPRDLFDLMPAAGEDAAIDIELVGTVCVEASVSALPCAFRDGTNQPCRRLATEPVLLDGKPFVHRGVRFLHCRPECFRFTDNP